MCMVLIMSDGGMTWSRKGGIFSLFLFFWRDSLSYPLLHDKLLQNVITTNNNLEEEEPFTCSQFCNLGSAGPFPYWSCRGSLTRCMQLAHRLGHSWDSLVWSLHLVSPTGDSDLWYVSPSLPKAQKRKMLFLRVRLGTGAAPLGAEFCWLQQSQCQPRVEGKGLTTQGHEYWKV